MRLGWRYSALKTEPERNDGDKKFAGVFGEETLGTKGSGFSLKSAPSVNESKNLSKKKGE